MRRQVLWQGEAAGGGSLAVLEGRRGRARYRLLKADHSILGGIYTEPPEYAGQSVYDAFYLQEAVRRARSLSPGAPQLHSVPARAASWRGRRRACSPWPVIPWNPEPLGAPRALQLCWVPVVSVLHASFGLGGQVSWGSVVSALHSSRAPEARAAGPTGWPARGERRC